MFVEKQGSSAAASTDRWRARHFTHKVLVVTHSHPRLTKGGAEISAGALASGMRDGYGVTTWLLGASRIYQTDRLGVAISQPFGENDFVYQALDSFNWFNFANRDPKFPGALSDILDELRPDIIHFHHYAQFGVEAFQIVKRSLPKSKIVQTLHEYLAICNNYGQMVKKPSGNLCEEENPIACSTCFPETGARDFFIRKIYISKFFANVDMFVSPSQFLRDRYIRWGVAAEKFRLVENVTTGVPTYFGRPLRSEPSANIGDSTRVHSLAERNVKVGFFGQLSPLKGINLLLDAARILLETGVDNLSIEIHGSHAGQPPEFQTAVDTALAKAGPNVRYHGPYENFQVYRLMRQVDAVVVPSTWWENSPVVIEEALTIGKPVLCSNIGGMAEKIRDGIDGFHFEARDSQSLSDLLTEIAQTPALLSDLAKTMRKPAPAEATVAAHLDLYNELIS